MITWVRFRLETGISAPVLSCKKPPSARRKGAYTALHNAVRALCAEDPESCGIRLYVARSNTGAQRTYEAVGMDETIYRLFEEELPEPR